MATTAAPAGAAAPPVASPANPSTASSKITQTSNPAASSPTQSTTIQPGTSGPADRSFWARVRQILGHIANVTTFCNSFTGVVFTIVTFFALGIAGYQYNNWSKAMAVWNADKIFQDGCRTQQEQGLELLEDCRRALATTLPAPPGSSFNLRKRAGHIRELANEHRLLLASRVYLHGMLFGFFHSWGLIYVILGISLVWRRTLVRLVSFGVLTQQTWLAIIGTVLGSAAVYMLAYPVHPLTASMWLGVLFTGALVIFKSFLVPNLRTEGVLDMILNDWLLPILFGILGWSLALYHSRSREVTTL